MSVEFDSGEPSWVPFDDFVEQMAAEHYDRDHRMSWEELHSRQPQLASALVEDMRYVIPLIVEWGHQQSDLAAEAAARESIDMTTGAAVASEDD